MPEIVGYCRVSTDGQTLDAQITELKAAGATKLFAEKQSGARSDRPQLRKALGAVGEGDVLMVTRLDRLARSTRDLLNVLHEVAQSGAAFKSLHDHWADTTSGHFMPERYFPEPWSVEELDACFVVKDLNGQALAYIVFRKRVASPTSQQ